MGIIRFTGPDSGTWHPESDPAEPLSAEEEAELRRVGENSLIPLPLPVRRLLATLDAARQSAPATEPCDIEPAFSQHEYAVDYCETHDRPAADCRATEDPERMDDPWLADIVRCGEAALGQWQEAHRNEETLALTFVGPDGAFYEGIRSVVERLRDYHFVRTRAALAPHPDPAPLLELAVDAVLAAFPPQPGGTPRSDALRRLAEARGR